MYVISKCCTTTIKRDFHFLCGYKKPEKKHPYLIHSWESTRKIEGLRHHFAMTFFSLFLVTNEGKPTESF